MNSHILVSSSVLLCKSCLQRRNFRNQRRVTNFRLLPFSWWTDWYVTDSVHIISKLNVLLLFLLFYCSRLLKSSPQTLDCRSRGWAVNCRYGPGFTWEDHTIHQGFASGWLKVNSDQPWGIWILKELLSNQPYNPKYYQYAQGFKEGQVL